MTQKAPEFVLHVGDLVTHGSRYEEWLPESGYLERDKFLIEYYDEKRFQGMDNPESELDIYVPIVSAE